MLPGYKEGVIIQPGLFKGTYGDHGLELVLLTYEDDDSKAVITKITVCMAMKASQAVFTCYFIHSYFHPVFSVALPTNPPQCLVIFYFDALEIIFFTLLTVNCSLTYLCVLQSCGKRGHCSLHL